MALRRVPINSPQEFLTFKRLSISYPPVSTDDARILKVLICLEMGQFKRETRSRFAPFRSGSHVNKLKQFFFRTKIQVPSTGGEKMRFCDF